MGRRLEPGTGFAQQRISQHQLARGHQRVGVFTTTRLFQRAQRHVPNSITTLRFQLGVSLAIVLGHCPDCNSLNLRLPL